MNQQSYLFALLLTAFGVILMSVESLLIKLAHISAITYTFYIGMMLFLLLNGFLLRGGLNRCISVYKQHGKIVLITALFTALSNMLFIGAVKHTTVANVVIIISAAPLFATLFAYLLYREKPHKNIYIASFFIFIGLLIIFAQELSQGTLLGDLLALLCAVSFSLTFVIISKHTTINIMAVLAFAGLLIMLFSLPFIKSFEVDERSLYLLLFAGLFVTPFSRVFVFMGSKILPASEVTLLTILETVLAPILAWMILDELPTLNTMIGGFIILLALVINTLYLIRMAK